MGRTQGTNLPTKKYDEGTITKSKKRKIDTGNSNQDEFDSCRLSAPVPFEVLTDELRMV